MKKTLITLILLISSIIGFLPNDSLKALEILPKKDFSIDTTLVSQIENFNLPDSIIISPIAIPADMIIQETDLYSGIFYYETIRLNQKDFLSHYFVTTEGQVLEGNSLGADQRIKLYQNDSKPIIINFFIAEGANDFTINQKQTLKDLILKLANEQSIPLDSIFIKEIRLLVKPNEPVLLKLDDLQGSWQIALKEIVIEITPQYKPTPRSYSFAVEKITVPTKTIVFPETFEIQVVIKNTSSNVLFQDTIYEPIMSKLDNVPSKFFLNEVWLSQTQSPIMDENSSIKPNESKTFTVKLKAPLYFGEIKESYQLISGLGRAYTGTNFELSVNVERPAGKDIVEITKTETGQLNYRDNPFSSSNVIGRVTPGQRFIVLERTDSGYIKLDLGNGKTGWVVSKYTKTI